MALAAGLFVAGVALSIPLVVEYASNDWSLPDGIDPQGYLAVLGLLAMIASFMTFTNTLLLHAALLPRPKGRARP